MKIVHTFAEPPPLLLGDLPIAFLVQTTSALGADAYNYGSGEAMGIVHLSYFHDFGTQTLNHRPIATLTRAFDGDVRAGFVHQSEDEVLDGVEFCADRVRFEVRRVFPRDPAVFAAVIGLADVEDAVVTLLKSHNGVLDAWGNTEVVRNDSDDAGTTVQIEINGTLRCDGLTPVAREAAASRDLVSQIVESRVDFPEVSGAFFAHLGRIESSTFALSDREITHCDDGVAFTATVVFRAPLAPVWRRFGGTTGVEVEQTGG